jgi:predicted transcriptional regulator
MENENDQDPLDKKEEEKEKIRDYIEQMVKSKKAPVAKDLVKLEHVETKPQEVSQETLDLAKSLRDSYIEHDQFEILSNDELTILQSFMGKRMFLTRIAIVANQSRIPLGIDPFKKADLEKILEKLMSKGYVKSEQVRDNLVYFLTERGENRVQ